LHSSLLYLMVWGILQNQKVRRHYHWTNSIYHLVIKKSCADVGRRRLLWVISPQLIHSCSGHWAQASQQARSILEAKLLMYLADSGQASELALIRNWTWTPNNI
jgi:hypothetical protein